MPNPAPAPLPAPDALAKRSPFRILEGREDRRQEQRPGVILVSMIPIGVGAGLFFSTDNSLIMSSVPLGKAVDGVGDDRHP